MINLLPPSYKKEIAAGKSNLLLWRYCIVSIILSLLLFATVGAFYLLLLKAKNDALASIESSNYKVEKYSSTQKNYNSFSTNLKVAKSILDKDVSYSKISLKIAQSLPQGIVLQSLTLDAKTFGKPMTINALGKDYGDALRLKNSFEKSDIFKDVHIESLSRSEKGENGFSVAMSISVIIKPESIE